MFKSKIVHEHVHMSGIVLIHHFVVDFVLIGNTPANLFLSPTTLDVTLLFNALMLSVDPTTDELCF